MAAMGAMEIPKSEIRNPKFNGWVDRSADPSYSKEELTTSVIRGSGGGKKPRKIAHFEILDQLGAGGMGVVYRARDEVLEREVALKLIRPLAAGDKEVRHRFLREARLAASINHSGVATLYEAGESAPDETEATQLFFASELVEGRSLEEMLGDGPLPVETVIDLGVQLAEALEAAHDLNIVHRDIKPSNVMVTPDNRVKVLDFGVAKRVGWGGSDQDSAQTLTYTAAGVVVGTPAYMAPEQVAGGAADSRTDIHGAGCVLYQMLTGKAPFGSGSPSEVMRRVIVTPPEPMRTLRAEIPGGLAEVVEKALAKEADDRYQSAGELADALRTATASTGVKRAMKRVGSRAGRWAALAAVVLITVGVAMLAGKKLLGTALPFEKRDWLLVTDVINETGDEGFTLALKSALETDLRQSRHVNVFDGGQVRNTLKYMRRDGASDIDLATGLDVCRFAGVRALLVPQINVVDDVFILQASLVDPATGRTADRIRLTAKGRDQVLLESIDELTRTVRRRLGESMQSISETDPSFTQYTTSSWEALRLVALASNQWAATQWVEAATSFELALEEDPKFAIARASLGLLKIQFLGQIAEGKGLLVQALSDASEVSRREFLHVRAVNRQFVDEDFEGALADYNLFIDLYPDDVVPYNNSGRILQDLGRYEEAVRMFDRARAVDPRSIFPVHNMWWVLIQYLKRPAEAEEAARALVELQPENPWSVHALAWTMVSQRRFEEAEKQMRAVLEIDPNHTYGVANLAHLLYRRGAYDEAAKIYRAIHTRSYESDRIDTDIYDSLCLGLALKGAGRIGEAREVLEGELVEHQKRIDLGAEPGRQMCLLAALGKSRDALGLAREIEATGSVDLQQLFLLAETYALAGEVNAAALALERAFEAGYDDPYYILVNPPLSGIQDDPVIDRLAPIR